MGKQTLSGRVRRYILEKYGVEPVPSGRAGDLVFRHDAGGRFAVLSGDGETLSVRVEDPLLRDLLLRQPGCETAERAGLGWLAFRLDDLSDLPFLRDRIDASALAAAPPRLRQALRPPKEWLVPANPKYYDILTAFDGTDTILWKQGAGIRVGDTVFLYAAAPVSAILYRCAVTETQIPCDDRGELHITHLMRLRLERRYDPGRFPFAALRDEYGVFAVRGPRGVPPELSRKLKK